MRILNGIVIVAITSLLLIGTASAARRLVVGELITNTGCGPCYAANLVLDQLAIDLEGRAIFIRYHGWWPHSSDPFYQYNISENAARINYYVADYAPHFWIDGNIDGESNRNAWASMLQNEITVPSILEMDITGNYNPDALEGEFTVTIYAESRPSVSNLKLRIALIESGIRWNAPNGLTQHDQTFRDMIPRTSGQSMTISEGETVEYTFDFATPDPLVPDNCMLVAFVQSDQNREILQGARVAIPDLAPTGIEDEIEIPESIALGQNYPNPFNAETMIDFQTNGGAVSLEVYDLTGALVRTLIDGSLEAGRYSATWNGLDENGNGVASGVYFYRLSGADSEHVKRMTLLK